MLDHDNLQKAENIWLGIATVMIFLLFTGVVASFLSGTFPLLQGGHIAGTVDRTVDPKNLAVTPFAKPGLREGSNGTELFLVAKVFTYDPPVVRVPAGQPINMHITSADVTHGFYIQGSNVNLEIVPGQVSSLRYTFKYPGTYNVICNEYCGAGHHNMVTRFIVTPPEQK